jgi:hypothetical protein
MQPEAGHGEDLGAGIEKTWYKRTRLNLFTPTRRTFVTKKKKKAAKKKVAKKKAKAKTPKKSKPKRPRKTSKAKKAGAKVKKVYQFRTGSGLKGGKDKAEIVGKTLEQIANRHRGELRPADVVSEAKRRQSPLHDYFEWDDSKAAREYRLEQARLLIRSVEVRKIDVSDDDSPKEILVARAFPNLGDREGGIHGSSPYRQLDTVLSDREMTDQWVEQALNEANQWAARYNHIKQLEGISSEIEKAEKALKRRAARRKKRKKA